jgi:crotonobetainyl-CoA:carnitine CoA-transferase CaiB-like acyl-CoA transferase
MLTALKGVRVLDLTRMLAGPFGSMILGDLGADVIKVERPGTGDDIRQVGPHFVHGESVYFLSVNRNKRSVCIDMGRDEGRMVLADIAARCDVVIENFRAGVAERLGCDHATLSRRNPRVITCGITAFGRTGPDRELPAFDLTLQARGGVMGLTGNEGDAPVRCGVPIGDLAGGLYAAIAINAALYERERTGVGQMIDLSLLDCQVSLLSYAASNWMMAGHNMGPQGSGHAHAIPYQAFQTATGWITVAVFTDTFWEGFCLALDHPEWVTDSRMATQTQRQHHREEVLETMTQCLRGNTSQYWLERLYSHGVPAGPVQRVSEVCDDPQVRAREMIATMEHPRAGKVYAAGNPIKMGDWKHNTPRSPPELGAHTREVLADIAGYDTAKILELLHMGIVT